MSRNQDTATTPPIGVLAGQSCSFVESLQASNAANGRARLRRSTFRYVKPDELRSLGKQLPLQSPGETIMRSATLRQIAGRRDN
jgi:hypothetical protein